MTIPGIPASVTAWLTTSTSIGGIAAITGGVVKALMHGSPSEYVPMIVIGIVAVAMKQTTPPGAVTGPIIKTLEDAIAAVSTGGTASGVQSLIADAPGDISAIEAAFAPAPATASVAVSVTTGGQSPTN